MKYIKTLVAVAAVAAAFSAHAESDINTGATAGLSAVAKLDFRVVVPRIIFLRVGTGTNFADALGGTNIDRVDFNLTAADVGSGAAIAGAAGQGPYPVVARVLGNGGNVSFTAVGSGTGLSNGTQVIPWSQIVSVASGGSLPHPAIGGAASALTAAANIVDQTSTWNFSYSNSTAMASGQYNGQVTYTAALP